MYLLEYRGYLTQRCPTCQKASISTISMNVRLLWKILLHIQLMHAFLNGKFDYIILDMIYLLNDIIGQLGRHYGK